MNVYSVSHIVFEVSDLSDGHFPVERQFVTTSPAQAAGIASMYCMPCDEDDTESKRQFIRSVHSEERIQEILDKSTCESCGDQGAHSLESLTDESVDTIYRWTRKMDTQHILNHLLSGEDKEEWGFLDGDFSDGFGWWVLIERLPLLDGPVDVGYGTNATINIDGSPLIKAVDND